MDGGPGGSFVSRILVAVQEAGHQDFATLRLQAPGGSDRRIRIQSLDGLPIGVDALTHLGNSPSRNQGQRAAGIVAGGLWDGQAGDLENVAKASRHQQAKSCPGSFD